MKRELKNAGLAAGLILIAAASALPRSIQTNTSLFAGISWAETYSREVDLMHSLFNETNKNFDLKVYDSIKTNANDSAVISFRLVSCIFYYPTGIAHAPSTTEMTHPNELICLKTGIHRRSTTNSIPVNYVRVSDVQKKNIEANIEVLISVSPLEKPQEARCFRRSFRFIYRSDWKEDD